MGDFRRLSIGATVLAVMGCSESGTGPSGPQCTAPTAIDLAVGAAHIHDAANVSSCISVVGGPEEREYLVWTVSANGQETPLGIQGLYSIRSEPITPVVEELITAGLFPVASLGSRGGGPEDFHRSLRLRERAWARSPAAAISRNALVMPRGVPVFGDKDTFNVCASNSCSAFTRVGTTVRYVGPRGVIYLDDDMVAGGESLTQGDLDQLGELFDDYIYPLDTTAFGVESDIDNDDRIAIVITDQVNALTTNCSTGRVVGYFFSGDLLPSYPGSNQREAFYTFAPKPSTGNCSEITRARALSTLGAVLIHELQHMISFNQRVLVRGGDDETLWLNEGLSHFAEELGQRLIPDARCPNSPSCFSEYATGNLNNAYQYLSNPEAAYLIAPTDGNAGLPQRGAAWLFVRWLADHFAADTLRGTQLTRALLQSTQVGAANVTAATGQTFATLAAEWGMANWVDNLPGFVQAGRLRYRTWDLRDVFARNSPNPFPRPYPLIPDISGSTYVHFGTLRGGSGHHLRLTIPAGQPGHTIRLAGSTGSDRLDPYLNTQFGVVRIR